MLSIKENLYVENEEAKIERHTVDIFHKSRNNYGKGKMKKGLIN